MKGGRGRAEGVEIIVDRETEGRYWIEVKGKGRMNEGRKRVTREKIDGKKGENK